MTKSIDTIGDIAIVKFHGYYPYIYKKFFAWNFLRKHKQMVTVLEKTTDIRGVLRKFETRFLSGINKRETIHNENQCKFFLNVDETYFSPRLSNERKITAEDASKHLKNNSKVLIMFGGVAPYAIVLAKMVKKMNINIYSSELNKKASEYATKNILLNKVEDKVKILQGDSRKINIKEKFDIIFMPRPNLKESFINSALKFSKKGTIIFYHGFGTNEKVLEEVNNKRLKVMYIRKAGDIAPNKWRWLVKLQVI